MSDFALDYGAVPGAEARARPGIARVFLCLAVGYGLVGMGMGLYMGGAEDWTLAPAHAHINLLGWVTTALYALVYRAAPQMAETRTARWHLGVSTSAMALMIVAFPLHLLGVEAADPLVAPAMIGQVAGMILFASLAIRRF